MSEGRKPRERRAIMWAMFVFVASLGVGMAVSASLSLIFHVAQLAAGTRLTGDAPEVVAGLSGLVGSFAFVATLISGFAVADEVLDG